MLGAATATAGGFVLAGGRSARMGTDKALLPIHGITLLEFVAGQVREAAGNVTIVADPARYAHFGFPVIADLLPNRGPLGGLLSALEFSVQPWNLIVACDMPNLDASFLREILKASVCREGACECLAPVSPSGPQPLCAVYHRRALGKLRDLEQRNVLKMMTVIGSLETCFWPVPDPVRFRNINTPAEWASHE